MKKKSKTVCVNELAGWLLSSSSSSYDGRPNENMTRILLATFTVHVFGVK